MKGFLYYLSLPLIFLISLSPFWLLYSISDLIYFLLFYVTGYRKKVVYKNLVNSFPEKTDKEIDQLQKKFYKYLCDLMLETLKTLTWNEETVRRRVKMHGLSLMNGLFEEKKNVILVMGHLGNWEWAGPGFSLNYKHQLYVVYQPLSNKYFEKLFAGSRTKFSTKIIPRKETLRKMIVNKTIVNATALIADQAPTPVKSAIWIDFLNQRTAVFNGPEKIAKKLDTAVVYMDVKRVKRGFYEITPTLLCDKPKETADLEITMAFNRILEKGIISQPETWLWSHRRWKHTEPNIESSI